MEKEFLNDEAIKKMAYEKYPEDIHETSKGCFDDMNDGERYIWMNGAKAFREKLIELQLQENKTIEDTKDEVAVEKGYPDWVHLEHSAQSTESGQGFLDLIQSIDEVAKRYAHKQLGLPQNKAEQINFCLVNIQRNLSPEQQNILTSALLERTTVLPDESEINKAKEEWTSQDDRLGLRGNTFSPKCFQAGVDFVINYPKNKTTKTK